MPVLYMPVGKTTEIRVETRDVIHSFWIVEFLYKKDMIPGQTNYISFTPEKVGTFMGKCAELCGEYHSMMLFEVRVVEQVKDQRGRDVVGQVADDAQAVRLCAEATEVELQRVALVQIEVLAPGEFALQDGDQVEVELDDIQMRAAVEQSLGQCALAWADLHQSFTLLGMNRPQDAVNDASVVQEVLAKALACAVLIIGHRGSRAQLEA